VQYQRVAFDRPVTLRAALLGGDMTSSDTVYRRRVTGRLSLGGDYGYRRASVVGDAEQCDFHTAQVAADYEISPAWVMSAGAGAAYLMGTEVAEPQVAPAVRVSLDRARQSTIFHIGYAWSFIPSFAFGGTVRNQELTVGYHTPLFNSRHFYTDQSAILRDNPPIISSADQLRLRSLRTNSVFGWAPQAWMRLEVFYSRVQQTSLRAGGQVARNRVGFQIITSKPMRMP
jgi:hypothetical protein